ASRETPPALPAHVPGSPVHSSRLTETYHAPSSAPTVPPPPLPPAHRVKKRVWAAFAVIVILALGGGFYMGTRAPGPPEKKVLLYGVLPDRRLTTERLKALEPVTKFLEASARRNFEPWVGVSYDDNIDAFVEGKIALAQFGGVSYVLLKERMPDVIPLFQRNVDQKFEAIFIVPASSPAQKLEDLKGKEIEFVDELSTAGYVVPAIELLEKGIDPAKDITKKFAHAHDTVVRDVAAGTVAAGVLDARIMDQLAIDGKLDRRSVRTIHISAPFPDDVWVASPSLEPKIRQRILDAFLALDPTRGADLATLSALESRQYRKADDKAYDDLRQKIQRLQARGLLRK
ncbi:MAG: phosphate/phosphite/phosphonate ABC transporter substrate-binding protein, partial [Planctomycetota bacterium]